MKLGRKGKKLRKNIIILVIITIITIALFLYFKNNNNNEINTKYSKETNQLIKKEEQILQNTELKTYYISAEGTSTEGTDINNPMSLSEANKKTFYGNEKILLKCGDTFYGTINFNVQADEKNIVYIGSYGEGEKPILSGANILTNKQAWESEDGVYKIDLSNYINFEGIGKTYWEPYNIGFYADEQGNIYGARKNSKDKITNEYDYYCEDNYLYIKCSSNPTEKLGKIKFASRNNLVSLSSNTIIEGINIQYTGAHGIVKKSNEINNVYIKDCIVQNIGGSVQIADTFTRYGNGIEFWNQAKNTIVENCIIRNIYDAGYTMQGNTTTTGFENNISKNNIYINATYNYEFFCYNKNDLELETIFSNQIIGNDISINQGRGWGYTVRPNKIASAELVLWGNNSIKSNANIQIIDNKSYNSRRLYFSYNVNKIPTDKYKDIVNLEKSVNYISDDTYLFNDSTDKNSLIEYDIDQNSTFRTLSTSEIEQINNEEILSSNNYNEIKTYYQNLEKEFAYTDTKNNITEQYSNFKTTYSSKLSDIEKTEINNIDTYLNNSNLANLKETELKEKLNQHYNIGTNLIERYKTGAITDEELYNMLNELSNIGKEYTTIYNTVDSKDNIDIIVNELITNANSLIENNSDLHLTYPNNLLEEGKKEVTSESTSENMRAKALATWSKAFANIYIDQYIENNPLTDTHSETKLTNKDVKVTLNIGQDCNITNNNSNNEITFTENGEYTFNYTRRGREFTYKVKVENIDKTPPKITGVENRKIYQEAVTPKIEDENILEIKLTLDGEEIQYTENMQLTEAGIYTITAKDKAGNQTSTAFSIIEKETDKSYIIKDDKIQNITASTNLETFKNTLNTQIDYKIYKNNNNNKTEIKETELIATGDILEIPNGNTYTLIVKGDCNKDGLADIVDVVKLRKYIVSIDGLDDIAKLGADVNMDGNCDIVDVVKLRKNIVQNEL